MAKITYCIECHRLQPGKGYQPCEPHQASRVQVIATVSVPAKLGRRAYQTKRAVATFTGSGMLLAAQAELARLTAKSKPKPVVRQIWGRSLTRAEYNAAKAARS